MNANVTRVEELLMRITGLSIVEDEMSKSIEDADGKYSEGTMTLDEFLELTDPVFAARGEVRLKKSKLEDELTEIMPDIFVDEVEAWELRNPTK